MDAGIVKIASKGGLCGLANGSKEPKNTQYLFLEFTDINTGELFAVPSAFPTTPGTYTIYIPGSGTPPHRAAFASYYQSDATCQLVAGTMEKAVSGKITLTTVNDGS